MKQSCAYNELQNYVLNFLYYANKTFKNNLSLKKVSFFEEEMTQTPGKNIFVTSGQRDLPHYGFDICMRKTIAKSSGRIFLCNEINLAASIPPI